MDILGLLTFTAVVDEGGVLAASKVLHTVQSNVTTRIKRLEEEVGADLFYRKAVVCRYRLLEKCCWITRVKYYIWSVRQFLPCNR